jgi:ureidoacrylate peracid hydrolase
MTASSIRVEARPFAFEADPSETAIIVVDMQQGFFGTGGAWNRAGVDVTKAQSIIGPIARVLTQARQRRLPIVYLTMTFDGEPPGGAGFWTMEREVRWVAAGEPLQARVPSARLPAGVKDNDILPELTPEPDDIVVVKPRHSGFYNTELDTMLKVRGITALIFTGGTTSICVESTLRDAAFRDYRCVLLADCTAELIGNRLPRTNHEATLMLVELAYGWVAESDALVRALDGVGAAVPAA